MRLNINWKYAVVYLIVAAGLTLLTHSFAMSLGILLLLFVIDQFLAQWDDKRRREQERNRQGDE